MKKEKIVQIQHVKSRIHINEDGVYALTDAGNLYFLKDLYQISEGNRWRKIIGINEKIPPKERIEPVRKSGANRKAMRGLGTGEEEDGTKEI